MMKNTFFTFCLFLACAVNTVHAQEDLNETKFTAGSEVIFEMEEKESATEIVPSKAINSILDDAEVTITEDKYAGQYVKPTLGNLSKLYWKMGALVESNDIAIDNFLLINECSLYQEFYTDDFEWQRVRDAGREMIKDNKARFPKKFQITLPIDLGRYDMKRKGFPLVNGTSFQGLRRIEIGGNDASDDVCGNDREIEHYPRNLILILNKQLNYDFVELDEHVAQALIIRQKYAEENRPKELRNKGFNRLVFARVRMTFFDYQGETRSSSNDKLALMFGTIDGIDIFEDVNGKRLLTSVNYNEPKSDKE